MISSFARSLHVTPPVILGRRMPPYSAYHQLTLEAFESPFFFQDGRPITAGDVVEAWLICCDRYGDGKRTFRRFQRSRLFRFIVRQRMLLAGWGTVRDQLMDYMAAFTFAPRVRISGDSRSSKVPVAWHLVAVMVGHGMPLAEAMDLPLCELVCLKIALAELNGLEVIERDLQDAQEAAAHPDRQGPSVFDKFFGSTK